MSAGSSSKFLLVSLPFCRVLAARSGDSRFLGSTVHKPVGFCGRRILWLTRGRKYDSIAVALLLVGK
jgi:hypothetical protein